jgi:large subunit ribosomal protein L18
MAIKYRNKTDKKRVGRFKKKMRIRKEISGTTERPRMSIFKSLSHLYVQLIDDTAGRTLASCSTLEKEFGGKSNKEAAKKMGGFIAKRAKEKNISAVVFDRNGYRYHGKVKEVADSAREAGLKF